MNSRNHHLRQLSSYSAKPKHNNNNKLKGEGLMQKARDLYEKAKNFTDSQAFADMINAIPSSDESARPMFAGEKHAILELANGKNGVANFMGPGTQVIKRLQRGDPPRTEADAVAKRHDIDYSLAAGLSTVEDQLNAVRNADKRMVNSLQKIENNKGDKSRNILLGKNLIQSKMLGEDLNLISKKEFAGPLQKLSDEEKDILLTNQAEMAQSGYGKMLPGQALKNKLLKKMRGGYYDANDPKMRVIYDDMKTKGPYGSGKKIYYSGVSASKTFDDTPNYSMEGSGDIPDNLPDIGAVLKNKVLPNLINKMGIQNSVSQGMINAVVDKTINSSGNIQDAIINLSKAVLPVIGMTQLKKVGLPPPQLASGYKKIMNNPKHKNKLLKSLSGSMYKGLKNHKKMKMKGGSWWDDFYDGFKSVLKPGLAVLGVVADALGQPEIGIPLSIAGELM